MLVGHLMKGLNLVYQWHVLACDFDLKIFKGTFENRWILRRHRRFGWRGLGHIHGFVRGKECVELTTQQNCRLVVFDLIKTPKSHVPRVMSNLRVYFISINFQKEISNMVLALLFPSPRLSHIFLPNNCYRARDGAGPSRSGPNRVDLVHLSLLVQSGRVFAHCWTWIFQIEKNWRIILIRVRIETS